MAQLEALGCGQTTMSWVAAWPFIEKCTLRCIADAARTRNISEFHLRLRTLLQLPRHPFEALCDESIIKSEVEAEAEKIRDLEGSHRDFSQGKAVPILKRNLARLEIVPVFIAQIIHEHFHYLHSFRPGLHFGLYLEGEHRLAAMATVSEMDVIRLRHYIPNGRLHDSRLLSRVFAFPWAPKNSLSYLLAALAKELRRSGDIQELLTWVNPNLGFRGASYKSANWSLIGTESVPYRYVDGVYHTAREIHSKVVISESRFSRSRFILAPLEAWHFALH